jgi:tRNA(fMet)-specific endonuclease VapC
MNYLLDTNILIELADGRATTVTRLESYALTDMAMSAISAAELEGSIYTDPSFTALREPPTRALLQLMTILPFTSVTAQALGYVFQALGYNRKYFADHMIAATALEHGLTLITRNVRDFADIPGLKLEAWA